MKRNMKYILSLFLSFLLVIFFTACSDDPSLSIKEDSANKIKTYPDTEVSGNNEIEEKNRFGSKNNNQRSSNEEEKVDSSIKNLPTSNSSLNTSPNKTKKNEETELMVGGDESKDLFITKWKFSEDNYIFTLPLKDNMESKYDFIVDWGDGSPTSQVSSFDDPDKIHTYQREGEYQVMIKGLCEAFQNTGSITQPGEHSNDLIEVINLGNVGWKDLSYAFAWNINLTDVSGGNTSLVKDMSFMFYGAMVANPDTKTWDISQVVNMSFMFYGAISALPETGSWDVSQVTDMSHMFHDTLSAKPETGSWDVSQVTDMSHMFRGAISAEPKTANWETFRVTDMSYLFSGAVNALPETGSWYMSQVTDMSFMFNGASLANPDTESWDTSQVKNMQSMFYDANNANPNTSRWVTDQVQNMNSMFYNAFVATPDTSLWDMGQVVDMRFMFYNASKANPNPIEWQLGSLDKVDRTFYKSGISTDNYSLFLIRANETALSSGAGVKNLKNEVKYDIKAEKSRQDLLNKGWNIKDGGLL